MTDEALPNIADALRAQARAQPDAVALRVPRRRARAGEPTHAGTSYAELDILVDELAAGLRAIGIGEGVRTALMVRPGVPFFALMFALLRARAVPVLIDPGIDRRALKRCLAEAAPEAFIGITLAQLARVALGWARGTVRVVVTVGPRLGWGGFSYDEVRARGRASRGAAPDPSPASKGAPPLDREPLAAILFTSGSTGVPKGVEYTHANFLAQVELIRGALGIAPGEIDLPTFPPFALFDPGLGMTSVIPRMDPTRPARADPDVLLRTIDDHGCTTMFGSPALLRTLALGAQPRDQRARTLRRVISAGAPVRPEVVERAFRFLPEDACIFTPYGATECLPVAIIEGREILETRTGHETGAGICVGRPLAANTLRIIAIDDGIIDDWSRARELERGAIGEITVTGPSATRGYFGRPQATALAKIIERPPDGSRRLVHRMGDLGYFDDDGRLWYVGRKAHRVETARGPLYPEQAEGVLNAVPGVARSALVGLGARGAQRAVACIELEAGAHWSAVEPALRDRARAHACTRSIERFLPHRGFPVDIRHNAKIDREALARWAARRA